MNLRSTIYRSAHIPAHTDRCAWPSSIHISSTSQSHIGNACHLADVNTHDHFRLHRARCLVALTTALPGLPEAQVLKNTPVSYRIKDSLNEIITGSFYEQELQKTNQEVYRVEKVLGKKKIDGIEYALVKWSGYSDKFNEWIPITDTKKL